MAKISVIIPNYNHGEFLPALLDGIFNKQERQPDEVIVVDDASTDQSKSILTEAEERYSQLTVVYNNRNLGVFKTVEIGLNQTTGDILILRAADDLDLPGYYAAVEAILEANPQAGICFGDVAHFGRDPNQSRVQRLGLSTKATYLSPDDLVESFCAQPICGHGVAIRRNAFIESGGFDPKLEHMSDWVCFIATAFRSGACYLPQTVVAIRHNHTSLGNQGSANSKTAVKINERLVERLNTDLKDVADHFLDSRVLLFLGTQLNSWGNQQLNHETNLNARQIIKRITAIESRRKESNDSKAGMGGLIAETLRSVESKIREIAKYAPEKRIAVYGAGGHTRILLPIWSQLRLPPVDILIVSDSPSPGRTYDLPVESLDMIDETPSLIVLSSESFESLFYEIIKEKFPQTPILSFWDPSITQLNY